VQITDIRASPDKEGCSSRVLRGISYFDHLRVEQVVTYSLESRYGICVIFRLEATSANFEMTSLSVSSLVIRRQLLSIVVLPPAHD
jgi:hypothetical protein